MIKVYGIDKETIHIEGSNYKTDSIEVIDKDLRVRFVDGTTIRFTYPKNEFEDVWGVIVETLGTKSNVIMYAKKNGKVPSDTFKIDAEVKSHNIIKKK